MWRWPSGAAKVAGTCGAFTAEAGAGGQAELRPHTQGPALMAPGGRSPPQVACASSVGDTEHLAQRVETSAERPLDSKPPGPWLQVKAELASDCGGTGAAVPCLSALRVPLPRAWGGFWFI